MNATSGTLPQATSVDLSSITFSQALAAGLTHSDWLDSPKIDRSLREAALASHSAQPASEEDEKTNATYGLLFAGSSPSYDLQACLANRLRALMDVNGSLEYELTWRQWDLSSGPPICRLRASERRTKDSGCGGWPTPQAHDEKGGKTQEQVAKMREKGAGVSNLNEVATTVVGWCTPTERDHSRGTLPARADDTGVPLTQQAASALAHGTISTSSGATSESPDGGSSRGGLNPALSRWLMGYPAAWDACAVMATP